MVQKTNPDLVEQICGLYTIGNEVAELAIRFHVGTTSIYRWLRQREIKLRTYWPNQLPMTEHMPVIEPEDWPEKMIKPATDVQKLVRYAVLNLLGQGNEISDEELTELQKSALKIACDAV